MAAVAGLLLGTHIILASWLPAAPTRSRIHVGWCSSSSSRSKWPGAPGAEASRVRVAAMMSRGRRPRWVGNDTRVEVLPPLDADGYDEQDNFAAVRPAAPGLSDESVSRILELVWRDTRKVASEYRLGDVSRTVGLFLRGERTRAAETPLFADLVKDRLPILRWYLCHKRDQAAVCLSECLERSHISPSSASDLQLWRARLQAGLEEQKTELWPTLRSLLLTESMHRRVVKAAQTQVETTPSAPPAQGLRSACTFLRSHRC